MNRALIKGSRQNQTVRRGSSRTRQLRTAPLCVLSSSPSCSKRPRSRWMVTSETRNNSLRCATCTLPCCCRRSGMWLRRCAGIKRTGNLVCLTAPSPTCHSAPGDCERLGPFGRPIMHKSVRTIPHFRGFVKSAVCGVRAFPFSTAMSQRPYLVIASFWCKTPVMWRELLTFDNKRSLRPVGVVVAGSRRAPGRSEANGKALRYVLLFGRSTFSARNYARRAPTTLAPRSGRKPAGARRPALQVQVSNLQMP